MTALRSTAGLLARLAPAALAIAALGGCGMSSITSGLGGGIFGSSSQKSEPKSVTEEQMLSAAKADQGDTTGAGAEVAHGCPKFLISTRDNTLTIYEQGRVGDGLAVMHRGEITKTARECSIEPGRVTVKYGFSGRILLGPRGRDGMVSLPLNIYVNDAKREKVAADRAKVDVQVSLDKPIGYFSVVKTVTFPIPEGTRPGEFELQVGFERNVPGAG